MELIVEKLIEGISKLNKKVYTVCVGGCQSGTGTNNKETNTYDNLHDAISEISEKLNNGKGMIVILPGCIVDHGKFLTTHEIVDLIYTLHGYNKKYQFSHGIGEVYYCIVERTVKQSTGSKIDPKDI